MKKTATLRELLAENGFTAHSFENHGYQHIRYEREFSKEVEIAFHGKTTVTFRIEVDTINDREHCTARFFQGGAEVKSRVYDTSGKRTFNAIRETARCAGFEF